MVSLIINIIAVSLFIVISVGGINYVDTRLVIKKCNEETVKTGFMHLISEYHIYRMNNKSSFSIMENASNLPAPDNMLWSYKANIEGDYFCLSGNMDDRLYNDIKRILFKDFNSVFVGNSCGISEDDDAFSSGDFKAFTLWVDSNYISEDDKILMMSTVSDMNIEGSESLEISLSTTKDTDLNAVTLDYEVSSEGIIDNVVFSGTGATRYIDFDRLPSAIEDSNEKIIIKAFVGGIEVDRNIINVNVKSFVCDSTDPLQGIIKDNNAYLIGQTALGSNSLSAKKHLLCISQNQTIEVLSADYKLMADVTFDIDFDVTKTYQDANGNENSTKTATYPFLKTINVTVNSNNEDWNGDDVVDGTNTTGWISLGSGWIDRDTEKMFTGSFDGNNHKVTNVYVNEPSVWERGFIGAINTAEVRNLTIENGYVAGHSRVGIVVGAPYNSIIENCHASGNVKAPLGRYSGGLAGGIIGSSANCSADVDVIGYEYIGGLLGTVTINSTSSNSYALGDVLGATHVGGLTGENKNNSLTENSYATGDVFGNDRVGGLAGYNYLNNSIIRDSYANGKVSGENRVGGLVGDNYTDATIINSYAYYSIEPLGSTNVGSLVGVDVGSINNASGVCEQAGTFTGYTCHTANTNNDADIKTIQDNWTADDWKNAIGTSGDNPTPQLFWQ